jgi:ubiquinone/menaquinone biosynthesis C-methylase UbiE
MEPKLQRRVQRYGWDAAVQHYDPGWEKGLKTAQDALIRLAELSPGHSVLETACGTGLVTLRAAASVLPGGFVFATDISGEMVEETTRRVNECGFEHVQVRRVEAEKLVWDGKPFDVALCCLGLMYVPEPREALAEMGRHLKPGGRMVATVWGERRNCGWADIFPIVDSVVKSEVCPLFFGLGTPGSLSKSMEEVGIVPTDELRQKVDLYWPNQESLLDAMIDGGAVALAAKRFSSETRYVVNKQFLDSVSSYRQEDGSYVVPGEFVTAVGMVQ